MKAIWKRKDSADRIAKRTAEEILAEIRSIRISSGNLQLELEELEIAKKQGETAKEQMNAILTQSFSHLEKSHETLVLLTALREYMKKVYEQTENGKLSLEAMMRFENWVVDSYLKEDLQKLQNELYAFAGDIKTLMNCDIVKTTTIEKTGRELPALIAIIGQIKEDINEL